MSVLRNLGLYASAAVLGLIGSAEAGSLKDIDHVVLFMQENRAFDHYFGTMAGVRGFNDANLQMNNGVPVWNQLTDAKLTTETKYVTPWYLNYLGGNWTEATQCMTAGDNGWQDNHAAWNFGTNDHWAMNNTPWSIGFYKRQDIPVQFSLADNFVVGDMYQEGIVSSTNPNRVTWASGTSSSPNGTVYIDNNETPGCEKGVGGSFNCYPLEWKTTAEYWEAAGTTWQVYQDADNFDDNPLAWFSQYQTAAKGSNLYNKGMKGLSLDTFYAQAANGTLPEISYIIGPTELSEHPPWMPIEGGWLQYQIARAVLKSPKYSKTALILSYDETGGWFDHVDPYRSPKGTPGEWLEDPYGTNGYTFMGPGFRLPFYIISPWTRKGGVFTAHSDHTSQIQFIEEWQAAKGRNVKTNQMIQWRREHMSDLTQAFDFDNPDYSIPCLPIPPTPHTDKNGNYDGTALCEAEFKTPRPPVPYTGNGVIKDIASQVEKGFKPMRGTLTEGRYLVLESNGLALDHGGSNPRAGLSHASPKHDSTSQRWIAHAVEIGGSDFTISDYTGKQFICDLGFLCSDSKKAVTFTVSFAPGQGYAFQDKKTGGYLSAEGLSVLSFVTLSGKLAYWKTFSVTY